MYRRSRIFVIMMLVLLAAGCGRGADVTMDVDEVADTLRNNVYFEDNLSAISENMVLVLYPAAAGDIVRQKVYASTGATAEEVAVFEAKDAAAAERIYQAVLQRIEEQKISFRDYLPAEAAKLEEPFIKKEGSYVVLCISGHTDEAEKLIRKLVK